MSTNIQNRPYVRIVEQPAPSSRFRYESERRLANSILGASSTPENRTYPAIQIVGFKGRAIVVVSCVTRDKPYKPHPHNLVGREGCKRGVCTLEIPQDTMSLEFCNLGIQCVKKKNVEEALRIREEIRVDPFRTGFAHRETPGLIEQNAVRLCFQVFLEDDVRGRFTVCLPPVVSDPILDKKATNELVIVKLSDQETTADGGKKDLILLCEKVAKDDIQVRFFEENDGALLWENFGRFAPNQVHKQTAIWFEPPPYHRVDIIETVKVCIQLRRPSDGIVSEPLAFYYQPLDEELRRKKCRINEASFSEVKHECSYAVKTIPPVNQETSNPFLYNTCTSNIYEQALVHPISPNIKEQPANNQENLNPFQPQTSTWNIPFQQYQETDSNSSNVKNEPLIDNGRLLDINQPCQLKQLNFNSGELGSFDVYDIDNLSETLNTNLSFSDFNAKD